MRSQIRRELRVFVVPQRLDGTDDRRGVNVVAFGEFPRRQKKSVFRVLQNQSEQLSPARIEFSLCGGDAPFQRSRALADIAERLTTVRRPNSTRLRQVPSPM